MIVRQNTGDNDWTFGQGKQNYLRDREAIKQLVKTRLQEFYGDCFWNTSSGIDYFSLLEKGRQEQLEQAIKQTIIETDGIVAIKDVNVYKDAYRRLYASYTVKTIYDEEFKDSVNLQS